MGAQMMEELSRIERSRTIDIMLLVVATLALSLSPQRPSNTGAAELAAPVPLEADGAPIDSGPSYAHSGPLFLDLDGDGIQELLVGNFKGTVEVFRRDARSASPAWKADGRLQIGGEDLTVPNW